MAEKYTQLNQQSVDEGVEMANANRLSKSRLQVQVQNESGRSKQSFKVGERAVVDVDWQGLPASDIESVGVSIFKLSGEHVTGINTRFSKHPSDWKERGHIAIDFKLDVAPGKYYVLVEVFKREGEVVDSLLNGPQFTVVGEEVTWSGLYELDHKWIERSRGASGGTHGN